MGAQVAQFALTVGSTAVLARLLAPRDFGLIAMAAAVGNLLLLFQDLGLGTVTVQRSELTTSQASGLFWINVALGMLLAVIMAGAAPLVARFYGQPALTAVTIALAAGFVLAGLSVQHTALLRRQMRFAALARIDIASLVLGVGVAITSAALGAGYWALVYLQLVQQGASACGAWLTCRWRPTVPARSAEVRALLPFGAGLTAFNVLAYLTRNLDNVVLGRAAGAAPLGLYLKAYSLLLLPVDRIRVPAAAVVVPALSHLQDDPSSFRRYFLKAIMSVVAVGMPAVVFLFVFADDAIRVVLGPQWRESVTLFQLLAPAAFVETFNTVGSWACTPLGKSARLVRWQIVATVVMVSAFLIGVRWGALGMAVAVSASTIVLRVPGTIYLLKGSPITPFDLLGAIARPACASLTAGAIVFATRGGLSVGFSPVLSLLIGLPVFSALYLMLWRVLPGGRRAIGDLFGLVDDLLPRRLETKGVIS